MAKNWASKAWESAEEGALTKKGWPNIGKLVAYVQAHPKEYAATIRQLLLIANGSKNTRSQALARSAIERLKATRKEE